MSYYYDIDGSDRYSDDGREGYGSEYAAAKSGHEYVDPSERDPFYETMTPEESDQQAKSEAAIEIYSDHVCNQVMQGPRGGNQNLHNRRLLPPSLRMEALSWRPIFKAPLGASTIRTLNSIAAILDAHDAAQGTTWSMHCVMKTIEDEARQDLEEGEIDARTASHRLARLQHISLVADEYTKDPTDFATKYKASNARRMRLALHVNLQLKRLATAAANQRKKARRNQQKLKKKQRRNADRCA